MLVNILPNQMAFRGNYRMVLCQLGHCRLNAEHFPQDET